MTHSQPQVYTLKSQTKKKMGNTIALKMGESTCGAPKQRRTSRNGSNQQMSPNQRRANQPHSNWINFIYQVEIMSGISTGQRTFKLWRITLRSHSMKIWNFSHLNIQNMGEIKISWNFNYRWMMDIFIAAIFPFYIRSYSTFFEIWICLLCLPMISRLHPPNQIREYKIQFENWLMRWESAENNKNHRNANNKRNAFFFAARINHSRTFIIIINWCHTNIYFLFFHSSIKKNT